MKFWARLILDGKVKGNTVYKIPGQYDPEKLFDYLTEICETLNITVPIALEKHYKQLRNYHMAKFLPTEFMDTFPYDRLVIELFE